MSREAVFIIFAVVAILAGFFTLFLPETNRKKLPESVEEGETFCSTDSLETMTVFIFFRQVRLLAKVNQLLVHVAPGKINRQKIMPLALKTQHIIKNKSCKSIERLSETFQSVLYRMSKLRSR